MGRHHRRCFCPCLVLVKDIIVHRSSLSQSNEMDLGGKQSFFLLTSSPKVLYCTAQQPSETRIKEFCALLGSLRHNLRHILRHTQTRLRHKSVSEIVSEICECIVQAAWWPREKRSPTTSCFTFYILITCGM